MTRCCTGATNKCAASRRPAAATTKRAATARIILVRRSAQRRRGEATTAGSTQLARLTPTPGTPPRRGALAPRSSARSPRTRSCPPTAPTSSRASTSPATSSRSSCRRSTRELAIVSKVPRRRCTRRRPSRRRRRAARRVARLRRPQARRVGAGAATERRLRCLREWELTRSTTFHLRADKLNMLSRTTEGYEEWGRPGTLEICHCSVSNGGAPAATYVQNGRHACALHRTQLL